MKDPHGISNTGFGDCSPPEDNEDIGALPTFEIEAIGIDTYESLWSGPGAECEIQMTCGDFSMSIVAEHRGVSVDDALQNLNIELSLAFEKALAQLKERIEKERMK